jgi:hypothetical protein
MNILNLDNSPLLTAKTNLTLDLNGKETRCLVRVYQKGNSTVAIFTDLNIGTKLSECIEHMVGLFCKGLKVTESIKINNLELIEYYQADSISTEEIFNKVYLELNWERMQFKSPTWETISKEELALKLNILNPIES